jgi:hypothetical protein
LSSARRIGLYGLVALVALFELVVVWLMLHPDVSTDFRAYYITRTTTCLDQPVPGTYVLGEAVDFLPTGLPAARANRVCGWEGPAGDGTHAIGTSSRLRFVYEGRPEALGLRLRMVAARNERLPATQRVRVLFNGTEIGTVTVAAEPPQDFDLAVPADLVRAAAGRVELELGYPDAASAGANDADVRWRSIKLLSAALNPA